MKVYQKNFFIKASRNPIKIRQLPEFDFVEEEMKKFTPTENINSCQHIKKRIQKGYIDIKNW